MNHIKISYTTTIKQPISTYDNLNSNVELAMLFEEKRGFPQVQKLIEKFRNSNGTN
jgi:hypothetical protein